LTRPCEKGICSLMNLLLTCGVVVTGIVIYMSTMLSLIYMFRLIILK